MHPGAFVRGYHCVQERSSPRGCNPYRINPTRTFRGVLSPRASFPRAHSGVAVIAGELPLAPTLHVVHQQKYGADYINKNTPRVTSRSCRGDREVARHIRMAHPTHIFRGTVTAGELPLAPTLHVVHQRNTQGLHQKMHHGLHRVAVGATGRSPATHPHGAPHAHIPGLLSPRASFHSPLHCILQINKIRTDYINRKCTQGYIA